MTLMDYPGFSLLLNRSMPKEIKPSVRAAVVVEKWKSARKSASIQRPPGAKRSVVAIIAIAAVVLYK